MPQHAAPFAPPRSRVVVQVLAGCAVAATLLLTGAHSAPVHSAAGRVAASVVTPTATPTAQTTAAPSEWGSGGS